MKALHWFSLTAIVALAACTYKAGCGYQSSDRWEMSALTSELKKRGVTVTEDSDGMLRCQSSDSQRMNEALAAVKVRQDTLLRSNGIVVDRSAAESCFVSWLEKKGLDYEIRANGAERAVHWVPTPSVSWGLGTAAYLNCRQQEATHPRG
jgi:hypothetical protein